MILEVLRMVTDALNDATYGVNAKLLTVQTDDGDDAPTPVALIADETRNGDVARQRLPEDTPCLAVTLDGVGELNGEVMNSDRDATLTVLIRYGTSATETEDGNRDTYYTMRAVQQTLRDFCRNDNAADRQRNAIQILHCDKMQHVNVFQAIEDVLITAGLLVTFRVRDAQP